MKISVRKSATPKLMPAPRSTVRRLAIEHPRRRILRLAAGAAALPALSCTARAQTYPTRPITIVVPFAPGGSTDVLARMVAERLRASLGQSIMVENVVGAGGSIAVGRVARAVPDGYTVSIGQWSTHVANGATYALQYDVLNDFEPVSLLADSPLLITARKTTPARDLREFIAWLQANPEKATQGHAGFGGIGHVAGLLLQKETGTRFRSVPYRGGAPAVQDLIAGHIDFNIGPAADTLPQVRSGNIRRSQSRRSGAWGRPLTSRPWMRRDYRDCICRYGRDCGFRSARLEMSSSSLTVQS
jgi:tripartite-type tricarboxylate transporter receptor subunit TctC